MKIIDKLRFIVNSRQAHIIISFLVLANMIILGIENHPGAMENHEGIIDDIDHIILALLCCSVVLRIIIINKNFFNFGWNIFDLIVISLSVIGHFSEYEVLASFRVLMIFRVIEFSESMKRIVRAIFYALKDVMSIILIMTIVVYAYALAGVNLYGHEYPDTFGDINVAVISLFQIMVFDDFGSIAKPILIKNGTNWCYFLSFLLCSAFSLINFFIGTIVESIHRSARDSAKPLSSCR